MKSTIITKNNSSNPLSPCGEGERDFSIARENFKLEPMQVTGYTDGEGGFHCSILKTGKGLIEKRVKLEFKITQKSHSEGMLYDIQKYFGCGSVVLDNRNTDTKKYHVTSLTSILNIIIPHFDNFPCISSKNLNFLDWKEIALIMERKEHLSKEGINKIIFLVNRMNNNRSFEDKYNYLTNSIHNNFELNPFWLQAFIDGEGTFYNYIPEQNGKYQICDSSLEIGQNNHDVLILLAIKNFFNAGYLKPKYNVHDIYDCKKSRSVNRFILRDTEKIIKFIDNFPLLTRKQLDYLDWKNIVELKNAGAHKTVEGLKLIKQIQSKMNSKRN